MARFRPVDPQQSFPALEEEVLARWRERDVFHESLRRRADAPRWVFYEGPPTANGPPGSHHVLSRVFKDVFPRYRTMRGYRVDRKAGWDCHGLPVELQIERELGLTNKHEIEAYGVEKFNRRCRESVLEYIEEWNTFTERIGFWIDGDEAYYTLDNSYIESVWWSLKQVFDKGLLYEGYKVVPYCPRCGTALSSHEVALGYEDVLDPSVYVRFPVKGEEGVSLLGWTTTPWTLLSNAALAVNPDVTYVRARLTPDGETLIVAEALAEHVLGEEPQIEARMKGSELAGIAYDPPFHYITDYGPRGHTVLEADFVTTDDGTGVVHTAIAFGEDDFKLGERYGITVQNPVKPDGTFDERIEAFAGRFVKDADPDIIKALEREGRLFRSEQYEHAYPHCWRCHTPLLYYAKQSWYVRTTDYRDELLANNASIDWHPEHIRDGRMGDWLRGNVDWALSRERYWGTPLPLWRCDAGHVTPVGSADDIRAHGGEPPEDLHKPFIDDVEIDCAHCDSKARRVPEVIDVWWDSGCMPFAQWHAPFDNEADFESHFPADYICEALDQTRGWFYSLLAISTLLYGRSSYKTCLCLGLILDPEGQKMSKSKGNIVDPWTVLDRHGADAFRWYYFTSKQPWDGYRFSVDTVGESVRQFMLTLWNTYAFYVLYANLTEPEEREPNDLDRWMRSRLAATVEIVSERMEAYDTTSAGRAIAELVDDLSNWYIRASRRRFYGPDGAAFATLHECLVTIAKLLAPLTPFLADEIFDNLDGSEPSVHLCEWPTAGERDRAVEEQFDVAREAIELGRRARAEGGVNLRQPLREVVIVAGDRERAALERFAGLVRDELNVKELRFVGEAEELGRWELKPNYRALGPRFGKRMPKVAEAVAALNAAKAATTLRGGGSVGVVVDGEELPLHADDVQMVLQPLEGYQVERAGTHAVALNLEVDDELRREGVVRDAVRAINNERKAAGLNVEDRIALVLGGDEELISAIREHEEFVAREVLATSVIYDGAVAGAVVTIQGRELRIGLRRA